MRKLYNRFQATLVPSERLADLLSEWGVHNVRSTRLGVNTAVFNPAPDDTEATRQSLGIEDDQKLLLYVGRLAKEKNTQTLFRAFELLHQRDPNKFHLLVIGDGPQRQRASEVTRQQLRKEHSWISYCECAADLARLLSCSGSIRSPGCPGNIWPCCAGEPGVRHAGGRNSRQLHGSDYLS